MEKIMFNSIADQPELDMAIEKYECFNNGESPYLVMSTSTSKLMTTITYAYMIKEMPTTKLGVLCRYGGNKVLIDDELEDGVIEIR